MAKALPYEIPSVVVDLVSDLDLPFALKPAPTVQYLVANGFVGLPLLGFCLVAGLILDPPLAVLVLLVHLHLLVVFVGRALVPLRLVVRVQVVEAPALLLLHANWEVPVPQVGLQHIALVDELPGECHWLLDHQQCATEMIIPDFHFWCPEFAAQEFVATVPTTRWFERVTRLVGL